MKRFQTLFLLPFIALFYLSVAFGAELPDVSEYDGNDWDTWDYARKLSFASGFIAGASNVISNNYDQFLYVEDKSKYDENNGSDVLMKLYMKQYDKDVEETKNKKIKTAKKYNIRDIANFAEYISIINNNKLSRYTITKITNGQLVEGLNQFYKNFTNKNIKVKNGFYVVRKQIQGAASEEIEAVSQHLRSPSRDLSKLKYKDSTGQIKWATFP